MLSSNRRIVYLLIVTCVGQVLLISAQVQSKAGVPVLENVAVGGFSQVQRLTAWFADSTSGIWSHYFALRGAAIENDQLKQRVIELEGQIQAQKADLTRTQALEAALGLQQTAVPLLQAARVIAGSPSPDSMTVTINQGSEDGVAVDMAVISAQGVVGRVIGRPTSHTAQVQLLIHRQASAAVKIERTGAGVGNAVGSSSDPPMHLEQVPNLLDAVRPGDRILTSGLDGIFPAGFLVGTVEKADLANVTRRVVTVRPAVDFGSLDIVLIVKPRPASSTK
jgi:rod shape-determining protein MreC